MSQFTSLASDQPVAAQQLLQRRYLQRGADAELGVGNGADIQALQVFEQAHGAYLSRRLERIRRQNWSVSARTGPPAKDAVATDGEVFEYGDTTLTTVLTSGHTPGTISLIINTTDNGTPHQVAL